MNCSFLPLQLENTFKRLIKPDKLILVVVWGY